MKELIDKHKAPQDVHEAELIEIEKLRATLASSIRHSQTASASIVTRVLERRQTSVAGIHMELLTSIKEYKKHVSQEAEDLVQTFV